MTLLPQPLSEAGRQRLGTLLVALQFGCLAALAWQGLPAFFEGAASAGAWCLALAGGALALWTLQANPPGNFNIRPTPHVGGRLVQQGPYRWIRHPMYSCVVLCGAALAWAAASAWAWLALTALVAVLLVKAGFEERWMALQHAGYAAYRAKTRRFIPGIF